VERKKRDVEALLEILNEQEVEYVVTGSAAAMLHGVVLDPGDLDITPALDDDNLDRLRGVLAAIHARQYENASFGHWEATAAGEHRWVREAAALPWPRQVGVRKRSSRHSRRAARPMTR
jgi:hypothetical protein